MVIFSVLFESVFCQSSTYSCLSYSVIFRRMRGLWQGEFMPGIVVDYIQVGALLLMFGGHNDWS